VKIYVESNFVLELALEQEQFGSCTEILAICEAGKGRLILPAYCLAEPLEKIARQTARRRELHSQFELELRQLNRRALTAIAIGDLDTVARHLLHGIRDDRRRFSDVRNQLLNVAEILPLTREVIEDAARQETPKELTGQDALVYSSVLLHLRSEANEECCFLNRNSRDFKLPNTVQELNAFSCKIISSFYAGLTFIRAKLRT